MSAFVVADETINTVVSWLEMKASGAPDLYFGGCSRILAEAGYQVEFSEHAERLADDMFALNVEAVNQRYGEGEAEQFRPLDFEYRFSIPPSPVRTVKALDCWMYQCAEGNVPETPLFKLMDRVRNAIYRGIVHSSEAYDQAPWG